MDHKLNIDFTLCVVDWRCADCNQPITPDTDSGWDVFVAPGRTQPVCKVCDNARRENFDGTKGGASDYEAL